MSFAPGVEPEDRYSHNIADLSMEALTCRMKGHAWKHLNDKVTQNMGDRIVEIRRSWRCLRCRTDCVEVLNIPTFDLIRRQYVYPAGYLLSRTATGGNRVDIREFREASLVRSGLIKKSGRR